jgi:alanine racemase
MADPASARLTIDLDALAHNFHLLSREAAGAEVAPVLKADGYGLGAAAIGRRLWAEGARSFFVARLAEGEDLRKALGPERAAVIYVLDGLTPASADRLCAAGLAPVLASEAQVAAASAWAAEHGRAMPVALQIDSGMHRQGLSPDEAAALSRSPDRLRGLELGLIISHLGSASRPADARNARQLAGFLQARAQFPKARASLAASAGVFLGPAYRFDLVRPGVNLYGGGPADRPDGRLRTVVTLEAPILDIRHVPAGEIVGYGSNFTTTRPTRVAVVGAGYADGLIRQARRGGAAWIAGARRPLLSVDMDLAIVDLADAEARLGEPVELLGPHILLDDLAAAAKTVAHEVLVRLSRRAERVYLGAVA